jgi:voltage-gated potassium channel Kch
VTCPGESPLALLIVPSQIVAASFVASVSVPSFLFALSRGPFMVGDLRQRLHLSSVFAIAFWVSMVLLGDELWRFDAKAAGDLLAGALIILSCILTTLIVLLLVAAGVSTTLLVSLSTNPGPVEIEPWLADYGHGFGVENLFQDRLNLLLGTRAAVLRESTIALVRGARIPVAVLEAAMLYFNFSKPTDR